MKLSGLHWILGKWKLVSKEETYETWRQTSDTVFDGRGYSVVDGKEKINESIQLVQRVDDVFYVATVPHNPAPVDFKLVAFDGKLAVFENLAHDFPHYIKYENRNGRLFAVVENQDASKQIQYSFERIE